MSPQNNPGTEPQRDNTGKNMPQRDENQKNFDTSRTTGSESEIDPSKAGNRDEVNLDKNNINKSNQNPSNPTRQ